MKRLYFVLIAVASFATISQSAFAKDVYYLHGSGCQSPTTGNLSFPGASGATFSEQGAISVVCPFVTQPNFEVANAALIVRASPGGNPNFKLGCDLTATDVYGNIVKSSGNTLSSGRKFRVLLTGLFNTGVAKFFYVTCVLPGPSSTSNAYLNTLELQLLNADDPIPG